MSVQLDHLSDRDLLMRVVANQEHTGEEITEIKKHSAKLNGTVAAISREQFFLKGALAMLSFIMIASLSAAGVAVAVFA